MHSDTVVIIPARIGSTRLANKILEIIGNQTMIEHVIARVKTTDVAGIYVATDSEEISSVVRSKNIVAIMTDTNCASGTERVYEAFKKIPNRHKIKYIINVQGDMPFINSSVISAIIDNLKKSKFDIMTSVVKVGSEVAKLASNVKVAVNNDNKALYFSRSVIPSGAEEFLYHVGVYGFKVKSLEKFASLAPTINEKNEKLEQLRALDNGMSIGVCYSEEIPISVDTKEDLMKAREFVQQNPKYLV